MKSVTYLYVIGAENGPVKIGITNSLTSRLAVIQTGCPFHAVLWFVWPLFSREEAAMHEQTIHLVYREHRLAGEWFDIPADQGREAIECAIDTHAYFKERNAAGEFA